MLTAVVATRVVAHPRRPRGERAGAAVEVDHGGDRVPPAAAEVSHIGLRHPAECAVVFRLAAFQQQLDGRRLDHGDAGKPHALAQRHRERYQTAERMPDQMTRLAGFAHHTLQRLRQVSDGGVARRPAFDGSAITRKARGGAVELALQRPDHRPPRGAGAAGAGNQHDARAAAAGLVVDPAADILDHAGIPSFTESGLCCRGELLAGAGEALRLP